MKFIEALSLLEKNKKIKREKWYNSYYVERTTDVFDAPILALHTPFEPLDWYVKNKYTPSQDDLFADDWMECKEKKG